MFLVMGITGKVGGATAEHLLAQGNEVRAVVRNRRKAVDWANQGVGLVDGDWNDAAAIERRVRAFDPWPGTFTSVQGTVLKVLAAELADGGGPPGTVLDDRLAVACGRGALRLTRVQLGGRAAMLAEAFLRGHRVAAGTVLGV